MEINEFERILRDAIKLSDKTITIAIILSIVTGLSVLLTLIILFNS
jgi:hypothetical protein